MRRALVTGATGFVGRQTLAPLAARGFEVHALSRHRRSAAEGVHWHVADLLTPGSVDAVVEAVRPSDLLHLAWEVEPGRFWTAEENLEWVEASLRLLRAFRRSGGVRVVTAGTCAEYAWGSPVLDERSTPVEPATLYGRAKLSLFELQSAYAGQYGLSQAWGRIFFIYGPHEDRRRLVASVVANLLSGEPAETSDGLQSRDFLHVEDLGDAFAALLESPVEGAVNLASGVSRTICSIVEAIGGATERPDLLRLGARATSADDPPEMGADVTRLRDEVGWRPRIDLETGVRDTVEWWRRELAEAAP